MPGAEGPERKVRSGMRSGPPRFVPTVLIEVFSDVVCPWCYIGKRRLELALAEFPHADQVDVLYRSFQLDPSTPKDVDRDPRRDAGRASTAVASTRRAEMNDQVTAIAAGVGLDVRAGDTAHPHEHLRRPPAPALRRANGRQAELKERLAAGVLHRGPAARRPLGAGRPGRRGRARRAPRRRGAGRRRATPTRFASRHRPGAGRSARAAFRSSCSIAATASRVPRRPQCSDRRWTRRGRIGTVETDARSATR